MNLSESQQSQLTKSSSFLTITNDALSTAMTKAIRLVSQSSATNQAVHAEEKTLARTVSSLKFELCSLDNKDSLPEISLDEVYWHDHSCDCWIVVYDRVFDITDFLQEHPGGEEVLIEHAGRDATTAFRGVGHSREALRALEKYLIGILPENERIYSKGGKKVLEMLTTSLSLAS